MIVILASTRVPTWYSLKPSRPVSYVDQQDAELAAAIHFVKRRRLGPFFQGVADKKTLHRHMGSLARAGFSLSICRAVLDNNSIDVLDKLERQATQTGQLDE